MQRIAIALLSTLITGIGLPLAANDGWQLEASEGFGSNQRVRVESLAVFDDLVWAGVYDPTNGLDIWVRTVDPGLFLVWFPAVQDGFGNSNLHHPVSMATFTYHLGPSVEISRLYVGTSSTSGGGEIWATDNVNPWIQIATGGIANASNASISALEVFSGSLYAGTQNTTTGAETYHFTGITWPPADMTGGFGDTGNSRIESLVSHGGKLWAAVTTGSGAGEIWSSPNGTSWSRAHAAG